MCLEGKASADGAGLSRRGFLGGAAAGTAFLGVGTAEPERRERRPMAVSVRDFGAKGDGVTDDTAAFQRALDQRGVVFVPAGVYACRMLRMHSHTRLTGESKGNTILMFKERADGGVLNVCGEKHAYEEDVIIENLTVDGNFEALYRDEYSHHVEALELYYARDFVLRNVHARNAVADGIDIDACEDFVVEGCSAENCGKFGLHITRLTESDVISRRGVVRDCRFWNNGFRVKGNSAGMDVIHSEHIIVQACISYNNYRGFTFYPGIAEPYRNVAATLISDGNQEQDIRDRVILGDGRGPRANYEDS